MKVVETKYGIQITKPWNNEMYDHNDKVAELMKAELLIKLELAKETEDEELLRNVAKIIQPAGYGSGYEFEDIYNDAIRELEMVENYWLNEEYPYGVSKGIVPSVELEFIGY
jgi:rubrerythrin